MSTRIEVYQSDCKVYADKPELDFIKGSLTKKAANAQIIKKATKGRWDGTHYFFNATGNTFKTGLLDYVCEQLKKGGFDPPSLLDKRWIFPLAAEDIVDLKVFDLDGSLVAAEYRNYQLAAIQKLSQNAGGLIHIATNGGKSLIIAGLIMSIVRRSPMKALVVVHRQELFDQIKDLFIANCDSSVIGIITADEVDVKNKQIVIAMVQTLNKRIEERTFANSTLEQQQVTAYVQETGILVIDEVHHAKAKTYRSIIKVMKKCLIKAGFSGTVQSSDDVDGLSVRELIGTVVMRVSNQYLIDNDYSLVPKIFSYCIQLPDMEKMKKLAKRDYYLKRTELENERVSNGNQGKEIDPFAGMSAYVFQRVYEEGIVYNKEQTESIIAATKLMCARGLQTLIIVNRRESHGKELCEAMDKTGIPYVFWTGLTKDRKGTLLKFSQKEVPVMLATSVVDEGLNVHVIDCIILASGLKSHIQLLQRIGRGLRKGSALPYLLVMDFIHLGEDSLTKHSKERMGVWRNEGFPVRVVNDIEEMEEFLTGLKV